MNRSVGQTNRVYLQCFQKRPFLSKILREKVLIQKSRSNWHLISFDLLITAHVIRSPVEPLVDSGYSELNWKILAGYNEGNMIPL